MVVTGSIGVWACIMNTRCLKSSICRVPCLFSSLFHLSAFQFSAVLIRSSSSSLDCNAKNRPLQGWFEGSPSRFAGACIQIVRKEG